MKQMRGKRVLVTGAGTGIGREVALQFAREGATVAFHYSHSADGACSAVETARRAGVNATALAADFNNVEEVQQLGEKAVAFLGGLDVLVNNAGISMNMPFEKVSVEQFETLYHVNIRAQYFLTQKVLPELLRSRGVIVNITSTHALQGHPDFSVYSGTKAAIIAYSRDLAVALAPKGVRVNVVAPGAIEVESHHEVVPDYDAQQVGKNMPCGFVGQPRDVADTVLFLASDQARYIVGQTIVVDGGASVWKPSRFHEFFQQPINYRQGKGYVPGV
jgi:glucose 1-dehydrogenase